MEMEERDSGLVVPKKRAEPPARPRMPLRPLEIQNDKQRDDAKKALSLLWDAMGLSSGGRGLLQKEGVFEAHYLAYRYVGEMLLGDECPEKEMMS